MQDGAHASRVAPGPGRRACFVSGCVVRSREVQEPSVDLPPGLSAGYPPGCGADGLVVVAVLEGVVLREIVVALSRRAPGLRCETWRSNKRLHGFDMERSKKLLERAPQL